MSSRWFVLSGLIVLAAVILIALQVAIERETLSNLSVLNHEGATGTALIVYHPGLSELQERVTAAFAEGLVSQGWRVERTTTSSQAPLDLRPYKLLVLGVHTYWFAPDRPTRRYLGRIGDLQGIPTVVLLSALGAAGRATLLSETMIRNAGGDLIMVQPLYVMRPNDENDPRPNHEVALSSARSLGERLGGNPDLAVGSSSR